MYEKLASFLKATGTYSINALGAGLTVTVFLRSHCTLSVFAHAFIGLTVRLILSCCISPSQNYAFRGSTGVPRQISGLSVGLREVRTLVFLQVSTILSGERGARESRDNVSGLPINLNKATRGWGNFTNLRTSILTHAALVWRLLTPALHSSTVGAFDVLRVSALFFGIWSSRRLNDST